MKRVRVIPVLTLYDNALVKSVKFRNYQYVGDPINAVKIFNEKEVDELAIIDMTASRDKRTPDIRRVREIASEAFMPVAYGGGITTLAEIVDLISCGVEKIILNNILSTKPQLVAEAAKVVGRQSVVVSMDVRKDWLGRKRVFYLNNTVSSGSTPVEHAKKMEELGAGEIIINSIDMDGTYKGYDIEMISEVADAVNIPVIALGGAGNMEDFLKAIQAGASAVAAGSMFVFKRPHQAVLISYPGQQELREGLYQKI